MPGTLGVGWSTSLASSSSSNTDGEKADINPNTTGDD